MTRVLCDNIYQGMFIIGDRLFEANMNFVDIIVLIITSISLYIGWRVGLIQALASLAGIILAIILSSQMFYKMAPVFSGITDSQNAANVLGFLTIFLLVLVGAGISGSFLRKIIRIFMLGWLDQMGGAILGVILAFTVLSTLLTVVDSFPILGMDESINEATLGRFLTDDFASLLRFPNLLPEDLRDKVDFL